MDGLSPVPFFLGSRLRLTMTTRRDHQYTRPTGGVARSLLYTSRTVDMGVKCESSSWWMLLIIVTIMTVIKAKPESVSSVGGLAKRLEIPGPTSVMVIMAYDVRGGGLCGE